MIWQTNVYQTFILFDAYKLGAINNMTVNYIADNSIQFTFEMLDNKKYSIVYSVETKWIALVENDNIIWSMP